jgi:hypothetical protein
MVAWNILNETSKLKAIQRKCRTRTVQDIDYLPSQPSDAIGIVDIRRCVRHGPNTQSCGAFEFGFALSRRLTSTMLRVLDY